MRAQIPVSDLAPAGPPGTRPGIRLPQLMLSLLVVAVFALLAVWWQASSTERIPVLALARDVPEGEALTNADLTEIYLSTDVPAATEDPQYRELFIGVRAAIDLPAGTIITDSLFRAAMTLGDNEALVGVQVSADEAPPGIGTGDRVQVLLDEGGEVIVLVPDAIVESVVSTRDGATARLQLRMGVAQAQRVQVAADDVVVIEVRGSSESSWDGLSGELDSPAVEGPDS